MSSVIIVLEGEHLLWCHHQLALLSAPPTPRLLPLQEAYSSVPCVLKLHRILFCGELCESEYYVAFLKCLWLLGYTEYVVFSGTLYSTKGCDFKRSLTEDFTSHLLNSKMM